MVVVVQIVGRAGGVVVARMVIRVVSIVVLVVLVQYHGDEHFGFVP